MQCDYNKKISSLTAELDMMRKSMEQSHIPGYEPSDATAAPAPAHSGTEAVDESAAPKRRSGKQRKASTEHAHGRKKSTTEVPLSIVELDQENAEPVAAPAVAVKATTKRTRVSKRKYVPVFTWGSVNICTLVAFIVPVYYI